MKNGTDCHTAKQGAGSSAATTDCVGIVVKLDRGLPLVRLSDGRKLRCKHAVSLVKGAKVRAVVGDRVRIDLLKDHDVGIIAEVLPRKTSFVRKDPADRVLPQTLAANFDVVLVAQPLEEVNARRLERELVLAHETGAKVAVVLTKADLAASPEEIARIRTHIDGLIGSDTLLVVSGQDAQSIEALAAFIAQGNRTAVLIGRSGVGKSSLVNMLVGQEVQEITPVRSSDGKGRHTTVSREIIALPQGGYVIDMPGVRGLGLWDAEEGIEAAFSDVEEVAIQCRFRDCTHSGEPGCAVSEAIKQGLLAPARVESYVRLRQESGKVKERRAEAKRIRGRRGHPRRRV